MLAPKADPPSHLRAHVMRAVVRSSGGRMSLWESTFWRLALPVTGIAVVALLLVTVGMFSEIRSLNAELETLQRSTTLARKHEQELTTRVNAYREAMALMNAKDSRQVRFGAKQPDGRIFVNPRGLVMIAANLPLPPAGRTYELWLLRTNGGLPVPAGVFDPDPKGNAIHIVRQEIEMGKLKAVAISDEPPGGLSSPTGKIFLVVPVAGMTR
jgi:anti-sigma-K factor RskA